LVVVILLKDLLTQGGGSEQFFASQFTRDQLVQIEEMGERSGSRRGGEVRERGSSRGGGREAGGCRGCGERLGRQLLVKE
jgi:hypothetical protein